MASVEESDDRIQEQLPEDLVYLLLLYLPSKILLRFSCLSKTWYQIIHSRSFNSQRSIVQKSGPATTNIIQCYKSRNQNWTWSISPTATIHRIWGNEYEPKDSFNIKLPFLLENNIPKGDRFYVSELSCDGLLCVVYKSSVSVSNHRIYLWNPCARKFRTVTWPEKFKNDCYSDNVFIGFGYDSSIDGYKIVVMKSSTTGSGNWKILVSSITSENHKMSVWSENNLSLPLPRNLVHKKNGFRFVTIRGDIYWIGKVKIDNSRYILKFNIANKTVATLPIPSEIDEKLMSQIPNLDLEEYNLSGRQRRIRLGHRNNECLYLYDYNAYCNYTQGPDAVEIWKYSSKDGDGFKKVISVPETEFYDLELIKPFGFTANGDFIISFYDEQALTAYVSQQGKLDYFNMTGLWFWPENGYRIGYTFIDKETMIVP